MSDEPKVVHEWRERGTAYRLRMITNGGAAGQLAREVFTAGQWAFDQWARLDARELARLAARCERLEEALREISTEPYAAGWVNAIIARAALEDK